MRHQARSYAVQALYQAELIKSKAMKHADRFLDQLETSPEVKAFARELIEGTLKHRKYLDRYWLNYRSHSNLYWACSNHLFYIASHKIRSLVPNDNLHKMSSEPQ